MAHERAPRVEPVPCMESASPRTVETVAIEVARELLESVPVALYYTDTTANVHYRNPEYRRMFGLAPNQSVDDWILCVHPEDSERMRAAWEDFRRYPRPTQFEYRIGSPGTPVRHLAERVVPLEGASGFVGQISDVTDVVAARAALSAAQKLESVGRLAAGVAHEINTPVQFVSDNVEFLRTSIKDLLTVIQAYRQLRLELEAAGDEMGAAARAALAAEAAADLDYIVSDAPAAVDSAIDGLKRIATIVRSMREFAHPDQAEKTAVDLNHAIQSTLIMARNEYKHLAELESEFGALPPVYCYVGDINQVVLNLLVNAAHAIADVVSTTGTMGKLTIRTRLDGDHVEIVIGDTGSGIPEGIRDKIYDPFFTTKEVGKGTGQGLALAHSIIVGKHGGTIRFETECRKGTTFYIRLPVGAAADAFDSPAAA